jgi:YihY family inner membrane protein
MNPAEWVVRKLDAVQQRFTPAAFVFAVQKKFGDDNGGVLVTNLAFTAFLSLFPLLLVLTTILGLVASADPSIRTEVISAVSHQIPLIGPTLTENVEQLRRTSVIGLIVGLAALIWGGMGLAQAGIFTMGQVWNLPGPERPGFIQRLGRSATFLGLLSLGVIVTTLLAGLTTYGHNATWVVVIAEIGAAVTNVAMFVGAFRILTPKFVAVKRLLPGAVVAGVCWTLLQLLGTFLVHHYVRADSVYGIFGTVLGFIAWIYVAVRIIVYSAEVNVVLYRHLWPRSIVQPPLTKADKESLALQALQNQRRKEEHVEVTFDETAGT